jgi:hypothetical protein
MLPPPNFSNYFQAGEAIPLPIAMSMRRPTNVLNFADAHDLTFNIFVITITGFTR